MHTEIYCPQLDQLNHVQAIRAIHEAWLQLDAIGSRIEVDGRSLDNSRALRSLRDVLASVEHPIAFPPRS